MNSPLFLQQQFMKMAGFNPSADVPGMVRMMVMSTVSGADGLDFSVEKNDSASASPIHADVDLGLRWNGDGNFIDGTGLLVAQDPTARTDGPLPYFFRKDALLKYLAQQDL